MKHTNNVYKCSQCDCETIQKTNHNGSTYSAGRFNCCPQCPPYKKYPGFGGSTVWLYQYPVESKERQLINFWELSEEWQAEAVSNHSSVEDAEQVTYFEPEDDQNPTDHILWDLSECMRVDGQPFDGVIGISNNSAMAVKLIDDETARTWFLS